MKTISHGAQLKIGVWEAPTALLRQIASRPFLHRVAEWGSAIVFRIESGAERLRNAAERLASAARNTLIERSLAFATYLERAEANAIIRSAQGRQSRLLTQPLPVPTLPDPRLGWQPRSEVAQAAFDGGDSATDWVELTDDDFDYAPTTVRDTLEEGFDSTFDNAPTTVHNSPVDDVDGALDPAFDNAPTMVRNSPVERR